MSTACSRAAGPRRIGLQTLRLLRQTSCALPPASIAASAPVAPDAQKRLRLAQESWDAALQAHLSAPPAPGYADRLLQLANAAEDQGSAFRFADREGLSWRPLPNAAESLYPPPELSPDFNRTGPPELWARFDKDVRALGLAFEGDSSVRIAQAFDELSDCLRELAYANRELEGIARRAGRAS